MDVPERIVAGLGRDRIQRIRMAWDYASSKLPNMSTSDRERLAQLVVLESRDSAKTIGEIALNALHGLSPEGVARQP